MNCFPFVSCLLLLFTTFVECGKISSTANNDSRQFVVTAISEPYVLKRQSGEFHGFGVDLLDELSKFLRFNYTINIVRDGRYGKEDENGTWNGMIGEVMRGEADLAVSDLTITYSRERVIDFTFPFMQSGLAILIKRGDNMTIQNADDLSRQTDIKYGCVAGGSTQHFFKTSTNPLHQRLFQGMESDPSNFVTSYGEGLERVMAGNYGLIIESAAMKWLTMPYGVNNHPDLIMLGGIRSPPRRYGIAVREGSPLRKELNQGILYLQETGMLVTLKDKWWGVEPGGNHVCDVV